MEENQGSAQTETSGANSDQQTNNSQNQSQSSTPGKVISEEDHKNAIQDMLRFKAEAKKNAEALQKLNADLQRMKETGLKSQNDYKTYSEALEKERDSLKEETDRLKKSVADTFRQIEVREAAKKLGLQERALPDLDLLKYDEVEVEFTTNGRVLVNGAPQFAEMLKKTRPHWFTSGQAANINTGGKGNVAPEQLTASYMREIEKTDPKKYKELFPKFAKQSAQRAR
jgi:hypothetical protein